MRPHRMSLIPNVTNATSLLLLRYSCTFLSSVSIFTYSPSSPSSTLHKKNFVALVRERTIPTERPLLGGASVPSFAHRGRRVVGATDPHGRILGFLDWSRYYFFQVAPQLCSRGWVGPGNAACSDLACSTYIHITATLDSQLTNEVPF
jgi:hypothetical protein